MDTWGEGCTWQREQLVQRPRGGTGPGVMKELSEDAMCPKQSQGRAEWNCSRGEHHPEPHWAERETKTLYVSRVGYTHRGQSCRRPSVGGMGHRCRPC